MWSSFLIIILNRNGESIEEVKVDGNKVQNDEGEDGALILINSTLHSIHIKNYGSYR